MGGPYKEVGGSYKEVWGCVCPLYRDGVEVEVGGP